MIFSAWVFAEISGGFLVAFWDCKEARKLTSTPNIVDVDQRKHEASHKINVETQ